ncbi:cellulose biosynthesis protein BcsQ [Herbihabitans rhizosphaerae]|uniref:Cellulose biosynthesis protein BcsQ n=1 Tax=Herbihabitans rhizosphaerae TaxID=1872711 RepID=A0A4Q7KIM9_9PSEU|nr:ParA family protein [Herbihabitans rhizosphaerae]RZS34780.1 cellulose biosynthesis protein BcsQ [Herbihabitans rhizosphaerae]
MQTVAVLSLKGGVGKTTVVLGLASAALRRGARTLVVDLDPQCNATSSLDPPDTSTTLADVLESPRPAVVREAIAPSSWGPEVDVLVGSEEVEALNDPDPDNRRLGKLGRALAELARLAETELPYQLVLLDCPPSLGRLTRSALFAANGALVVTEPTLYAVSGAQRAMEAVEQTRREHNPELSPLGVVVNRVRARSYEHQFRIAELREHFGSLIMPVALPDRLAVQQAQGACKPIHDWGTPGSREVALAFNLVLARTLRTASTARGRHQALTDDDIEDDGDNTGEDGGELDEAVNG